MEIKIDRLGKRYQHGWVFKDLSYTFKEGTVYGVAGRNGSGKSTFLKIISGLLSSTQGLIHYEHLHHLIHRASIYTQVSVAAPYTELIEECNLAEMIDFHIQFKPSKTLHSVSDWLDIMELQHARQRPLYQFSSGMKQRVKLALAMYSASKILILDEPTSNLDDAAKLWFFSHLEKNVEEKIVLIASNEIMDFKLCSEILQM